MRRWLALHLFWALALFLLPPVARASTLMALDVPALTRGSEWVIHGRVVRATSRSLQGTGRIVTEVEVVVDEVLMSSLASPSVWVSLPGGTVGELRQHVSGVRAGRAAAVLRGLGRRRSCGWRCERWLRAVHRLGAWHGGGALRRGGAASPVVTGRSARTAGLHAGLYGARAVLPVSDGVPAVAGWGRPAACGAGGAHPRGRGPGNLGAANHPRVDAEQAGRIFGIKEPPRWGLIGGLGPFASVTYPLAERLLLGVEGAAGLTLTPRRSSAQLHVSMHWAL